MGEDARLVLLTHASIATGLPPNGVDKVAPFFTICNCTPSFPPFLRVPPSSSPSSSSFSLCSTIRCCPT